MMISLTNVWKEMKEEAIDESVYQDKTISRKYKLKNDVTCLIFYDAKNSTRQIGFNITNTQSLGIIKKYPKWHGIDISKHEIGNSIFLIFSQSDEYDAKIFELLMQDIITNTEEEQSGKVLERIGKILEKWKKFFKLNASTVLSEERQQGLYGELVLLEKLIELYGEKAVSFWGGWNAEPHDFYIFGNAIEVKTTSSNTSSIVRISNEKQLDVVDVKKKLFLYFLGIRKSKHDGEMLLSIVGRIKKLLENSIYLQVFEEKLFYSGYIASKAEQYKIMFFIRTEKCYNVTDGFPSLTSSNMPLGIHAVSYQLNLDICSSYEIEYTEMLDLIAKGED